MAAITLEELVKEIGVCPEKLNESIIDDHLREIALFLTSWRTVASHLDLNENDLDDAEQGGRKVKDKSLKALQIWKGKFGFRATYKKLVEVLLSLAMADVAEKVCNLLKEDILVHVSITDNKSQSDLREPEGSETGTTSGTDVTSVRSIQPPFQQLSSTEQDELKEMLRDDVRKMKRLFGSLISTTCDSVEERIPVIKFVKHVLALGAYDPAPEERDRSLLDEHRQEIKGAKSISEIFIILSAYWNYLSYEILEYIIEYYGTSDDAERLRNYNKKLHDFCKRRIFELPMPVRGNGTENESSPKQEKLYVKLDVREDIPSEQFNQIKGRIAKILHVRPATLQIFSIDEGCVQLTFVIPKFVAQEIFPLSCEQASALSEDVSVIRLECGNYIFETDRYTEDAGAHNTVLEGVEDKSQPQTEPCAERQVQTPQANTDPQTTGEVRPDEATEPAGTSEKSEAGAVLQKQSQKETNSSDDRQQVELTPSSPDSWQSDDKAAAMHSSLTPYEEMLENQDIYEQLTCAVCLRHYRDPRLLECCHSFCRECLVDMVTKRLLDPENPLEKNEVQCPLCRVVTNTGVGGVEELPVKEILCEDPVMKPFSHLPFVPPRDPVLSPTPSPSKKLNTGEGHQSADYRGHQDASDCQTSINASKNKLKTSSQATSSSPDVIDVSEVDSTPLDVGEHLFDVQSELIAVAANWRSIGVALRLKPDFLQSIDTRYSSDPCACLSWMVMEWLMRNYNVEKFGEPSWRMLVEAVAHPAGGANTALARRIAMRHKAEVPWISTLTKAQQTKSHLPGVAGTQMTATTHELSKAAVFAHENRQAITAKFAAFQTKVCNKLLKNRVDAKQFRLFVTNQFPPGDCIPPPPAGLTEIFEAITHHGLWDYFNYFPLVHIVRTFGADDPEMEGWVQTYKKDLKAYSLVATLEDFIETDLDVTDPPIPKRAKYDPHYYTQVEWKTNFIDHSLQYLCEVWESFSSHYLVPDCPPTALLDRVRRGCFLITWLVPSYLIPALVRGVKVDTEFFHQHHILKVTVGEECVFKELTEENKSDDTVPGTQQHRYRDEDGTQYSHSSHLSSADHLDAQNLSYDKIPWERVLNRTSLHVVDHTPMNSPRAVSNSAKLQHCLAQLTTMPSNNLERT